MAAITVANKLQQNTMQTQIKIEYKKYERHGTGRQSVEINKST